MSAPRPPAPRKRTWHSFALVGFIAGVITVILVLLYLRPLWHR